MAKIVNVAEQLERWVRENEQRFSGRFNVVRVNDWAEWQRHGTVLDLEGDRALGRVTTWAQHHGNGDRAFADLEAIDVGTGEQLFVWAHEPLSDTLLSKWLSALEAH